MGGPKYGCVFLWQSFAKAKIFDFLLQQRVDMQQFYWRIEHLPKKFLARIIKIGRLTIDSCYSFNIKIINAFYSFAGYILRNEIERWMFG